MGPVLDSEHAVPHACFLLDTRRAAQQHEAFLTGLIHATLPSGSQWDKNTVSVRDTGKAKVGRVREMSPTVGYRHAVIQSYSISRIFKIPGQHLKWEDFTKNFPFPAPLEH